MPATYRFLIVDVFTDTALAGNQLAVFTNAAGMPAELMQRLAREIGFSETVFVLPPQGEGDIRIRIFTPAREVPFAGHPTLGTAFAVAGPLQSTLLRVETGSGLVPIMLEREGAKLVFGWMLQPTPSVAAFPQADELLGALRLEAAELPIEVYDNGLRHVMVAVSSDEVVAELAPDERALAAVLGDAGVSVFSATGVSAKTRMLMPELGITEDAATGSAAGPLAAHLARHGRLAWGDVLTISQGAEIGRPSTLYARVHESGGALEAVEVGGCAVVVAKGEFRI